MEIVRNISTCSKCGVTLCEKNENIINSRYSKSYQGSKCRNCQKNNKFCTLIYADSHLEIISKKQSQLINKNLWKLRNPNKLKQTRTNSKLLFKISSKNLNDNYIKSILINDKFLNLSTKDITDKMIELKRKQVIIHRKLKNQTI